MLNPNLSQMSLSGHPYPLGTFQIGSGRRLCCRRDLRRNACPMSPAMATMWSSCSRRAFRQNTRLKVCMFRITNVPSCWAIGIKSMARPASHPKDGLWDFTSILPRYDLLSELTETRYYVVSVLLLFDERVAIVPKLRGNPANHHYHEKKAVLSYRKKA